MRAYGSYENVKVVEQLSMKIIPELRVLADFLENNPVMEKFKRREDNFETPEIMRANGYSQERIQWTLKNQQITKTMRQQGYSEYEIAEKMAIMNPASKEDLQRMGFPEYQINILFPQRDP